jgi:hypothetical protein
MYSQLLCVSWIATAWLIRFSDMQKRDDVIKIGHWTLMNRHAMLSPISY